MCESNVNKVKYNLDVFCVKMSNRRKISFTSQEIKNISRFIICWFDLIKTNRASFFSQLQTSEWK